MHEHALIRSILRELSRIARRGASPRVLAVRLRLDENDHICGHPELFRAQFELAARGTPAEGAELDLVKGPLEGRGALIETVRLDGARGRLRVSLFGAVQGVGFRPFVARLAGELSLSGWVLNGPSGVVAEAEGPREALEEFRRRLHAEKPPAAVIAGSEETWLEPAGLEGFQIRPSRDGAKSAWLLPDLATCPQCLAETLDPARRRHGYPFTNCTLCGPRFTIVTAIPYDRANTTMAGFALCRDCAAEYARPSDRRFHAQPIACPRCGPKLWLERGGSAQGEEGGPGAALEGACRLIREGAVLALKGLGGFLLLCDARSSEAVERLRERKRRGRKPFALLFPDIGSVRSACEASPREEEWLLSQASPIVLLRRKPAAGAVAPEVAPGSALLGAMLPYSPLHHLLSRSLAFPVVATSGNRGEEPICRTEAQARERLAGIADAFLMHDRPIARHADDSLVRESRGRQCLLRRSRGYAPLPLRLKGPLRPTLALGAQLKSTVSIAWEDRVVVSQHLGDLETAACREAFQAAVNDLLSLYDFKPELAACDLHPDYPSTRFAESLGLPLVRIQHHLAHVASCMAEQEVEPPALGVAWDGIGLGADGTLWGGEFLIVGPEGFSRFAHLRAFPLPGGEAAVREPRRSALGLLHEAGMDMERLRSRFAGEERNWKSMLRLPAVPSLSPRTSSAGRLFDAVAALAGLADRNGFEGEAAMALESSLDGFPTEEGYPLPLMPPSGDRAPLVADWGPMVSAILRDADAGTAAGLISARFHNALAALILQAARKAGIPRVVLSGGVFQNAYLTERAATLLEDDGFSVFSHQRLPPNDGGISAGQAYLAGSGWNTEERHVPGSAR